ncbi:hypothetical protein [Geoalkalibacter subterraneus]|uniref:Uncharacterized protein n=1 Tax=Geoalkalibacter subterraneus TaxID=483547 RepID=A0A0B5FQX8_9BACT|nr:hypothetical protein [Geoalkalibacter subterraneus]AJF05996.1 hypothetical protein GSUB_04680 [Geoalkalibacter subterraneus]
MMFLPDETRLSLAVEADQVLTLYRSINPVQVSLPGVPGQKAGAFVCVFFEGDAARIAVVLELHEAGRLYFYFDDDGPVPAARVASLLDEALYFVEAMGYLMVDLEWDHLEENERDALWRNLPLKQGMPAPVKNGDISSGDGASDPVQVSGPGGSFADKEMEARRQRVIANLGRLFAAY